MKQHGNLIIPALCEKLQDQFLNAVDPVNRQIAIDALAKWQPLADQQRGELKPVSNVVALHRVTQL